MAPRNSQDDPNRLIWITLKVPADQTRLLEGLEMWLHLGLLSDAQVCQLSQTHLVCQLPEANVPAADFAPAASGRSIAIMPKSVRSPFRLPQLPVFPNFIAQGLQSFRAELSVIWLLFLGVFLVIVSSGVLAASQWQNFSAVAQYSVLASYTLAFWGVSLWTSRRSNLRLTSQMLQIATLLLIPINFWLMDALLWQKTWGWALAPIAALGLSAIMVQLLRPTLNPHSRLLLATSIGLSWLHWGWQFSGFPLIATYIGTIAAAVALFRQDQDLPTPSAPTPSSHSLSPGIVTVSLAILLLVIRAVWLAQVPIAQLGLALGICGWLLCWLSRQRPTRAFWTIAGATLLGIGWLVSVTTLPGQAIVISGLAIWLWGDGLRPGFAHRLIRQPRLPAVTAIFLIGLQAYWLVWRVLPFDLRQSILESFAAIAGSPFSPPNLAGFGFFPYVWLMLAFAQRLRRQQTALANHADRLTLALGVGLTLLSVTNPLIRSLNLILSTLTLAWVARKPMPIALIYLTHLVGLAATNATIDLLLPRLSSFAWTGILLAEMLAAWGFSIGSNRVQWRRSAWHLGLGLAGLSYIYMLLESDFPFSWSAIWLVTPLALTLLAFRQSFPPFRLAPWLSSVALVLVQPLTIDQPLPRLLSLGVATGLMVFNTQNSQHRASTVLTVGFGLSFAAAAIWQGFSDRLTVEWQMLLLSIAILILWLLHGWFQRQNTRLSKLYAFASDGWAIVLSSLMLLMLSGYAILLYFELTSPISGWLWATLVLTGAIGYRNWQRASDLGFCGMAWGLELLAAQGLVLAPGGEHLGLRLAIVNLAFGLAAQIAGDFWVQRSQARQSYRFSWHLIPLVYAVLGLGGSQAPFTAITGLYTLAASLVGIGVGRRIPDFKVLRYAALLGGSVAAYELLVYQLLQAQGGSLGDGVVLLAGLAALIGAIDRLAERWLLPYLRLSRLELGTIANLHWALGIILLLLSWMIPLSPTGSWLWVGVAIILAIDALIQGRSDETWTYAGIIAATGAIGYGLYLIVPPAILWHWAGGIAAVFAWGLHALPWETWGWTLKPWQRSALLLPGTIVVFTAFEIAIPALLVVAAVYAWFAQVRHQVRLSYVSLLLADGAIVRWLADANVQEPLWYVSVVGASLLYAAQVDPRLQAANDRENRHLLRCLAVGLVCLTGIYQSETDLGLALFTFGFSIALILAGLALRVRAFLYVGTATFILQTLRQLWLLISDYSLLLWAIGIVLGLAFIWIAATFEARRSQVNALLHYWTTELDSWG